MHVALTAVKLTQSVPHDGPSPWADKVEKQAAFGFGNAPVSEEVQGHTDQESEVIVYLKKRMCNLGINLSNIKTQEQTCEFCGNLGEDLPLSPLTRCIGCQRYCCVGCLFLMVVW